MIDMTTRSALTAASPGIPVDPGGDGGPGFAALLVQASMRDDRGDGDDAPATQGAGAVPVAVPAPPSPLPLPDATTTAAVVSVPDVHNVHDVHEFVARGRAVADHADRFDARGVLDMAAVGGFGRDGAPAPRAGAATVPGAAVDGALPRGVEFSLPAQMRVLPTTTTAESGVAPVAQGTPHASFAPVVHGGAGEAVVHPVSAGAPDVPEDAAPVSARTGATRAFPAMARGAPQIAVAALADGLAVVAAVGALSDAERHRLRDAIAATVARHGYHPRTVIVLAMPTPTRVAER